eukprot:m.483659 g.483659  ORF g.483659 m.483659 type:complete len:304 (-) comp23031_c0_seq1:27-938(-)
MRRHSWRLLDAHTAVQLWRARCSHGGWSRGWWCHVCGFCGTCATHGCGAWRRHVLVRCSHCGRRLLLGLTGGSGLRLAWGTRARLGLAWSTRWASRLARGHATLLLRCQLGMHGPLVRRDVKHLLARLLVKHVHLATDVAGNQADGRHRLLLWGWSARTARLARRATCLRRPLAPQACVEHFDASHHLFAMPEHPDSKLLKIFCCQSQQSSPVDLVLLKRARVFLELDRGKPVAHIRHRPLSARNNSLGLFLGEFLALFGLFLGLLFSLSLCFLVHDGQWYRCTMRRCNNNKAVPRLQCLAAV